MGVPVGRCVFRGAKGDPDALVVILNRVYNCNFLDVCDSYFDVI